MVKKLHLGLYFNLKMNNEKNRLINLKRKFRVWCEKTTVHAVPNIVNNEQLMFKLMWTICLIASICYCGKIFTASIVDYFEFRVLTKFEIVQESFSLFPGINCTVHYYNQLK
jgi:hypothetical protein